MLLAELPPLLTKSLILIWLFATGGAIGSFLNVVVLRLPGNMSLLKPGSHCLACKRPIRWYDNVPIVSWFVLGGRCRDCQAAISVRYPIVEAITAGMFLLFGLVEGLSWGANLPARPVMVEDGLIYPSLAVGELVGLLVYHLVLLSTLLAAAIIEWDGHQVPWRLALPTLLIGGIGPLIWPHLHPVPASRWVDGWVAGLIDSTAGLVAGTLCGLITVFLIQEQRDLGRTAVWACVGLMLGWQATVVLAVASTALYLFSLAFVRLWPEGKGPGWLTSLTLAALVWLLFWAPLANRWPALK